MNSSNKHQRSHQPHPNRIFQSLLKFSSVRHQFNSSDAANSKAKKKIQDNVGQTAEPFRFWSLLKNVRTQSSAKNSVTPSRLRFRLPYWGFPSKNSFAANEMEKYNVAKTKIPRRMSKTLFFSSVFCLAFPFVSKLFSVETAYNPKQNKPNSTEEGFSNTAKQSEDINRGRRQQNPQGRARSRSRIKNPEPSGQNLSSNSGAIDSYKNPLLQEDLPKKKVPEMIDPKLKKYLLTRSNRKWNSPIEQLEVKLFLESFLQRRQALGLFSQQDVCSEFNNLFNRKFDPNTIIRFEKNELEPCIMLYYTRNLDKYLTIVEKLEKVYKESPQITKSEIDKLAEKLRIDKRKLQAWFDRRRIRRRLVYCSLYY